MLKQELAEFDYTRSVSRSLSPKQVSGIALLMKPNNANLEVMIVLPDLFSYFTRPQLVDIPRCPDKAAVQEPRLLGRGPDGKVSTQSN